MADDLGNRGPKDRARVNIHETWELEYWSKKFGCSKEKLKQAVAAKGTMAVDVEAWLKTH
jgi:hypothetical protein